MTPLPPAALPGRSVLSLDGDDTIGLLQSIVTANLARLGLGEVTHTALLTPQGKVLSAFFVWRTETGVRLDCAPGDAGALTQRLKLYKLRAAVEITGSDLAPCVGEGGPGPARPDPRLAAMGVRWLAGPGDAPSPDDEAYEARRIVLGVPEFGRDYGPSEVFAMDANLDALGAVDYKKGCFVGQEVASRMYRKGEVRKRVWLVRSEAALMPGAEVKAGGSTLGTVTSARGADGLALLRVDRVAAASGAPEAGGVPVALTPPPYLP